jgi:hypothetical protein
MSYIILGGRWCHIIVQNVHAPTENKTDDVKDSFYEKLECVFNKFPKCHMKNLLQDFSVGREGDFRPTFGNEGLQEIIIDHGVRVVNFASSKNLTVKSTMFSHCDIHKFNQCLQMGKPTLGDDIHVQVYFVCVNSVQKIVIPIWWWQKLGKD